jgi:hypothetical protein
LKLSTIEWKKVLSNTSNISSCSSHPWNCPLSNGRKSGVGYQ